MMAHLPEVTVLLVLATFVPSVTANGGNGGRITINALGRTFTLGMLYNRRNDQILYGKALWDDVQLQTNISRLNFQSRSKYEDQEGDSIRDKTGFMDVETGIKASFLSGLVSADGSAGYLYDFQSSNHYSRMTLKYDAKTHFEQLTMAHLSRNNIRYPEVLEDDEATHVVTGIEYGFQIYFIFERQVAESSQRNRVYAELRAVIDALPNLHMDKNGNVKVPDELVDKVNNLTISVHSDFVLPQNPTTYQEAGKLYKELPNYMIGEDAHSVPMTVYLYPVWRIEPSGDFSIIRDISESLVDVVVTIMQELEDAREEAQDLTGNIAFSNFDFFQRKVHRFLNLLRQYKQEFQRQIRRLLVRIRGSEAEESELTEYLQQHFNSPFSRTSLEMWINSQKEEGSALKSFVEQLEDLTLYRGRAEYIRSILTHEQATSLNMYFPELPDPVLDNMDDYLDGNDVDSVNIGDLWFNQLTILHNFQINIEDIISYQEVNRDSSISFIWAVLPSQDLTEQWPSSEIKVFYSEGRQRHEEVFIPPGQPLQLTETTEDDSITIQWQHPQYGSDSIEHYQIEVTERGHRLGQDPISYMYRTTGRETQFQISTPESSVPYDVTVHGVCRVGRTASSEILHHSGVEVRLVGGGEICSPRRAYTGRVEVLYSSVWGTICAKNRWTDAEAVVICRMMGYTGGAARWSTPELKGSGPIWISNVRCNGSEENLDLCSFTWAGEGQCNHTMDAVVDCYGGEPTGNATTPEGCMISELQELLMVARSNLNFAREELIIERVTRREEMQQLREEQSVEHATRREEMEQVEEQFMEQLVTEQRARISQITSLRTKINRFNSVAFHATTTVSDPTIRPGEKVKFNNVQLNDGNGYSSTTGVFTVPPGGAGVYYLYVHLLINRRWYGWFDLKKNGGRLCVSVGDSSDNGDDDYDTGTCAATVRLSEGDRVYVERFSAPSNNPLFGPNSSCGFTGFLLKPAD